MTVKDKFLQRIIAVEIITKEDKAMIKEIIKNLFPDQDQTEGPFRYYFVKHNGRWGSGDDEPGGYLAIPVLRLHKEMFDKSNELYRKDLISLYHRYNCTEWKSEIGKLLQNNYLEDLITIPNELIAKVFQHGTQDQIASVVGLGIKAPVSLMKESFPKGYFMKKGVEITGYAVGVRTIGKYKDKAFILNNLFEWTIQRDEYGIDCLLFTRRFK